jgi:tRNA/rRNA methyltransferase
LQVPLRERVAVLLVMPETGGNVGSVARLMKNFGFANLIILNPQCEFDHATDGFAMHGKDVLERARVVKTPLEKHLAMYKNILKEFDLVIGTTAKGEHYANLKRAGVYLEDLQLPELGAQQKICIVFGRESSGLWNDEISCVDFVVRIRTNPEYTSLNLSHAAGLILYQLFLELEGAERPNVLMASREQKDRLDETIRHLISQVKVRTFPQERVLRAFQNVLNRAYISQQEFRWIYGLLRRVEQTIDHIPKSEDDQEISRDIEEDKREK